MTPPRCVLENESRPATLRPSGPGHRSLGLPEVEAAVGELQFVIGRETGLARGHVDGASGRVLAKQRALRSAQHLDPLDVQQIERGRGGAREVDAVDVQADALLDAVVGQAERRPDATDVDRRIARVGRVELHGRQQFLEPVDVEVTGIGHERAADHRDRDRHFLRDFLGASCRHHERLVDRCRGQREVQRRCLPGSGA